MNFIEKECMQSIVWTQMNEKCLSFAIWILSYELRLMKRLILRSILCLNENVYNRWPYIRMPGKFIGWSFEHSLCLFTFQFYMHVFFILHIFIFHRLSRTNSLTTISMGHDELYLLEFRTHFLSVFSHESYKFQDQHLW